MLLAVDWLNASIEERRAQYRAVKRLIDEAGLTWAVVYREALGEKAMPGHGYEDNFRAGRIGRKKAHRIQAWLAAHYPAYAQLGEIGATPAASGAIAGQAWARFVKTHGQYARLSAMRLPDRPVGIVGFAEAEPFAKPVIALGEAFCFQIEADRPARVMAFQSVDGDWYAMALAAERPSAAVPAGASCLPADPDRGKPVALSEEVHAGRHRFAFLIGGVALVEEIEAIVSRSDAALPPERLDAIAALIMADVAPWVLARINLLFVRQRAETESG